jgi:hypothetical protein
MRVIFAERILCWRRVFLKHRDCTQFCVSFDPLVPDSADRAAFSNPEAADADKIVDGYVIPRNVCEASTEDCI